MPQAVRLAPPPRRVPLSLRILNGIGSQIGWGLVGFSCIFFWLMVMNADFSFISFHGATRFAGGRITAVEATNARQGKQPVYAVHYEYSVNGNPLKGVSYTEHTALDVGQTAIVEYLERNPAKSRIETMRRGMFSPAVLFVLIFPAVGVAIIVATSYFGSRRLRILANGRLSEGTLVDKRGTNTYVNNRRMYELTFEYVSHEGHKRTARVTTSLTDRLEDEAKEPLLYDIYDPSRAFMLDELPSRPQVDGTGELLGRPIAAALSLILPAIVIVENLLFALAHV